MRLDICLATYNGIPWIKEFLNSLNMQTYEDWRLIVSDDGSKDHTVELIRDHFKDDPEKLLIVERECVGLGVIKNFQDAINFSDADYVLLADQDDVWKPEKIEVLYKTMRMVERNANVPTLVYSDLEVVDEHLNVLNSSWWSFSSSRPSWANSFQGIVCQNVVPGCAMMMNRSLIDLSMPFPPGIKMHDWWLLLVCLAFGEVGFTQDTLVRYRRHAGAHTYWRRNGFFSRLLQYFSKGKLGRRMVRDTYETSVLQASSFVKNYVDKLRDMKGGKPMHKALDAYIMSLEKGWWQRRWLLGKNRFHCASLKETVKFYMYI